MGVEISMNDKIMDALLRGDIDHHTAKDMRESIDSQVIEFRPEILKMNFGGIQFMDSSGIGLIMGRCKLMSSIGGKLKVVNVPKRIEKMVKLSGLVKLGIFGE